MMWNNYIAYFDYVQTYHHIGIAIISFYVFDDDRCVQIDI